MGKIEFLLTESFDVQVEIQKGSVVRVTINGNIVTISWMEIVPSKDEQIIVFEVEYCPICSADGISYKGQKLENGDYQCPNCGHKWGLN